MSSVCHKFLNNFNPLIKCQIKAKLYFNRFIFRQHLPQFVIKSRLNKSILMFI